MGRPEDRRRPVPIPRIDPGVRRKDENGTAQPVSAKCMPKSYAVDYLNASEH